MDRLWAGIVVLALMPALGSCRLFRRSKPAPPPAPMPAQIELAPPRTPPTPQIDAPPGVPPTQTQEPPAVPKPEQQPLPPPPAKKRPSPVGPRVPTQPPPATTLPPPAPQLRPMLTPAQKEELQRDVDRRLGRAKASLSSLTGKTLTREDAALAAQIGTFISQAQEARHTDPLRASNLAERAEVLARDLARRLR